MSDNIPLQDRLHPAAPIRNCYGCGADNLRGLHLKSFLDGHEGVGKWKAEPHHCSYPGYLNGGVACTLIDCHSAWTAFALECRDKGLDLGADPEPGSGWTRAMSVEFVKATPLEAELTLRASLIKKGRTSRTIACSIYANGEECVRGEVTIVMK
ncbi:MAG: PaaI family thioesterase [Desulfomonile tiedjei]|uniref:PaaI family thioesterase n=1 Tax=Desulfomonile tiedjei TaxID=2358 RepID=A0A9D6Z2J2_9BACT|nr:PaaI family thioesterase [Desulfomonile tiedjei]